MGYQMYKRFIYYASIINGIGKKLPPEYGGRIGGDKRVFHKALERQTGGSDVFFFFSGQDKYDL
jgi:hypothetical protein